MAEFVNQYKKWYLHIQIKLIAKRDMVQIIHNLNGIDILHTCNTHVTGFWKITLGLFHIIGPANGYTCTLHIHSAITRFG